MAIEDNIRCTLELLELKLVPPNHPFCLFFSTFMCEYFDILNEWLLQCFFFPPQFCVVARVVIIDKYIQVKFGNFQIMKVENRKHPFILYAIMTNFSDFKILKNWVIFSH